MLPAVRQQLHVAQVHCSAAAAASGSSAQLLGSAPTTPVPCPLLRDSPPPTSIYSPLLDSSAPTVSAPSPLPVRLPPRDMGNTQQASSSSSVHEGEALAGVLQGPAAIVTPSPDPSPVPLDAAGGLGAPVVPAASVALSPPQLPIMDQQAVILPHTVQPEVAGPSGGCRQSSSGSARGSARENRGEASGSGRRRRGRKGHESRYRSHRCRSRSSRWRSPSSSEYSSDSSMSPDRRSHRRGSRRGISRSSRRSTCGATRSHDVPIAVTPLDPTGPAAPHVIPVPAPAVGIPRVVSGCGIGGPAMPLFPLGGGEQRLMPLVSSSVAPATWSGHGSRSPVVVFLGHSFIFRAGQRAACRPGGQSLGFPNDVQWRGIGGLKWLRVLVEAAKSQRGGGEIWRRFSWRVECDARRRGRPADRLPLRVFNQKFGYKWFILMVIK
ncbi:uncharacterized protein LOC130282424 [Hyla sarda]|uniref:uncharacterized protein LOC130282424 n=2 Tax=Hyla sarda TaxID=327740 RepID=UPI0024C22836|nr:uncharacterized protein LOC130282424 [Hyla sarda]